MKKRGETISHARRLRRAMTLPEVLLWKELRKRPAGLKFRRQHPAGPFVLDFYCAAAHLCIEIGGEAHERRAQPIKDSRRDDYLLGHGVRTVRIAAKDVLIDIEAVVKFILREAPAQEPLHHPAALGGPPAQVELGED